MSFGGGYGSPPGQPGGLLASEADREAARTVLKQAFEDQRLTLEEFESRVGRAMAARTQGELAELTRDLPPVPGRPAGPRTGAWLQAAGIAMVIVAGAVFGVHLASRSAPAPHAAPPSKDPAPPAPHASASARPAANPGTGTAGTAGSAGCPVGTSPTALLIANALASDPVYHDPAQLTAAQARRLQAEIGRYDKGRIRIAAVTAATVRRGGGERALANAIASCPADAVGLTLVNAPGSAFLVTSYPGDQAAQVAVGAALNTHVSLAAGLADAIRRISVIDTRQ
jgi:hypothetical protein